MGDTLTLRQDRDEEVGDAGTEPGEGVEDALTLRQGGGEGLGML